MHLINFLFIFIIFHKCIYGMHRLILIRHEDIHKIDAPNVTPIIYEFDNNMNVIKNTL